MAQGGGRGMRGVGGGVFYSTQGGGPEDKSSTVFGVNLDSGPMSRVFFYMEKWPATG